MTSSHTPDRLMSQPHAGQAYVETPEDSTAILMIVEETPSVTQSDCSWRKYR